MFDWSVKNGDNSGKGQGILISYVSGNPVNNLVMTNRCFSLQCSEGASTSNVVGSEFTTMLDHTNYNHHGYGTNCLLAWHAMR